MSERVIPGVNVTVVKDVVVPQLSPAGVLGVVGLVEDASKGVQRAASWRRFVQTFGPGSAHSMPQARAALENGVTEVVVVPVSSGVAAQATAVLPLTGSDGGAELLSLRARAPGSWANNARVVVSRRARKRDGAVVAFDLEVLCDGQKAGEGEAFQNLQVLPGFSRSVADVLAARSAVLQLDIGASLTLEAAETPRSGLDEGEVQVLLRTSSGAPALQIRASEAVEVSLIELTPKVGVFQLTVNRPGEGAIELPRDTFNLRAGPLLTLDTNTPQGCPDAAALWETLDALNVLEPELLLWPDEQPDNRVTLVGGRDATAQEYINALDALVDEPDVDLVCAALQLPAPASEKDPAIEANQRKARQVYAAIISHCELMAAQSKGRRGFGHVPPGVDTEAAVELSDSLVSDRFVLASPWGTVGALAGRVGSLPYFQSPTMKTLAVPTDPKPRHGQEDQKALLTGRLVPVAQERGRGVVVIKGITTDGEQLSVRRVADRAARGVQHIGELFIGKLNNADSRAALRQKLGEFLYQMQNDGAIVPSADGKLPAFQLDVYSSQDDFSKGIVRVDLAVRPVRAIDYIYATLLVQV